MKERLKIQRGERAPKASGDPHIMSCAADSVRQFTLDHNPVHAALDRKIIVKGGGVKRTSIVPDDHVVQAPLVCILKLRLRRMLEELVE